MRKALLAMLVLAVGLVGCGSNKTGSTGSGGNTSSNSTAVGGGASAWCDLAKSYQNQSEEISQAFTHIDYSNPTKMRQQLADAFKTLRPKFKQMFDNASAVVPVELKVDFALLTHGFNVWMDALANANYDMTKLANSPILQTFKDPKFIAASNHVGQYGAAHCGISFTPAPSAT